MKGSMRVCNCSRFLYPEGRPRSSSSYETPVEPEQGAKHRRIQERHQRVDFVYTVFDWGAGEHEGTAALQTFDGLSGLGVPVLDALSLVQDDDVRLQACVDVERIFEHPLVVHDREEWSRGVQPQAAMPVTEDKLVGEFHEALDLFLPFGLQGCRGYHNDAGCLAQAMQQSTGCYGLYSLAQTHLVGQKRALLAG